MAKRDKEQGFYFLVDRLAYRFLTNGDVEKQHLSHDSFRHEIEKILAEAFELLDSEYKDPEEVLDMLISDLTDLRDSK